MKTAIVLIIAIFAQTAGDVYLTKGMKAIVVEDSGACLDFSKSRCKSRKALRC